MHGILNVIFPGELRYWDGSNNFKEIDNLEYLIIGESVYY